MGGEHGSIMTTLCTAGPIQSQKLRAPDITRISSSGINLIPGPKKSKIGPLWKIWYFWITAKGFPTPCWHTSQHTLCMLNSSPNLLQSSQRWWTNISASYNPGNKMAVCSNSFLTMTKCWVGHSEISYTSTVNSMDVHMHIPNLQTFTLTSTTSLFW